MSLSRLATEARQTRRAAGCLIVVPDASHIPGPGQLYRVDGVSWAVAIGEDAEHLALVLSVQREIITAAAMTRSGAGSTADLGTARAELTRAVDSLTQIDRVTTSAGQALRHIETISTTAVSLRTTLHDHLNTAARLLGA